MEDRNIDMTIDREDLLNSILKSLDRIEYIKLEDIPNIDLYMDQVTTFMEEHLRSTVRYPGEDKILTKTMINNYAKNNLLPPPVKKKYSKEHVLLLIFIYYYKGILTINDIQALLKQTCGFAEGRYEMQVQGGGKYIPGCAGERKGFFAAVFYNLYA